jgi:glutathione S-transferase
MATDDPLVRFYDLSGPKPWSPACWCTRYVLNYKRIKYTTVQVPFQDIKPTCEKFFPDMTGHEPTVPIIEILGPNCRVLNESTAIAELLNTTFTEKDGYKNLIGMKEIRQYIADTVTYRLVRTIFRWIVFDAYENALSPDDGSKEFYKMTREKETGCSLEDITEVLAGGEASVLKELEKSWAFLRERMSKEDGTGERGLAAQILRNVG